MNVLLVDCRRDPSIESLMRRAVSLDEPSPVLTESIALGIEIGRLLERNQSEARHAHRRRGE